MVTKTSTSPTSTVWPPTSILTERHAPHSWIEGNFDGDERHRHHGLQLSSLELCSGGLWGVCCTRAVSDTSPSALLGLMLLAGARVQ